MESESVSDDKEKLSRIIDNQDGNTMARAIRDALKLLRKQKKSPTELQIASAYFNPQGLELIAEEAKYLPSIRLLLGAEPAPEMQRYKRLPGDRPDPEWTEEQVEKSILNLDQAIREERNHLPFDIETDRAIRTLLDFLTSNKIEARRYTTRFLHAKAFLFLGPEEHCPSLSSLPAAWPWRTSPSMVTMGGYADCIPMDMKTASIRACISFSVTPGFVDSMARRWALSVTSAAHRISAISSSSRRRRPSMTASRRASEPRAGCAGSNALERSLFKAWFA